MSNVGSRSAFRILSQLRFIGHTGTSTCVERGSLAGIYCRLEELDEASHREASFAMALVGLHNTINCKSSSHKRQSRLRLLPLKPILSAGQEHWARLQRRWNMVIMDMISDPMRQCGSVKYARPCTSSAVAESYLQ